MDIPVLFVLPIIRPEYGKRNHFIVRNSIDSVYSRMWTIHVFTLETLKKGDGKENLNIYFVRGRILSLCMC